MLNSRSIQGIIVLMGGLFLAIWLGLSIVTNQTETILQVLSVAVLIGCIALGRRIWILIPFMAAVYLSLRLPGQPSSLLLGQALVLGFSLLLFLMRKITVRLAWTELEFWLLILTLFIMQVYMRNPVGVNIFGGDTVGGKGYALYAIAMCSALLFSGLRVPSSEMKWILPVSILGGLTNMTVSILGGFFPTIAYYTGASYADTSGEGYDAEVVDVKNANRLPFLMELGNNLSLWISAYVSPLLGLLRPFWLVLILTAVAVAGFSGFRNTIASVGLTLLLGIAYRSGFGGVMLSVFGGIGGIALLAVVNTMHPLPPNIQRSLTFLPGTWEQRYKDDAKGSSEWRFEIWREVLLTDRWIQNKFLGDGLGFSAAEFAAQLSDRKGARVGIAGFDAHRQAVLANGDYHSGPVSTVRVIGYIGLLFFMLAQIRLAVHAHRQINRCRGTEWFPLALFVGIPCVWGPVFFFFIFGDFKGNAASFLLALGMVRMLENNLPLPAWRSLRNVIPPPVSNKASLTLK